MKKKNKLIFNPRNIDDYFQLDPITKQAFEKTVEFFEDKGLALLKEEDRMCVFYNDWLRYQTKHKIYATLLTPEKYSKVEGARFDIRRIAQYTELMTFYSYSHKYSFQVSILGLGPIYMSNNEIAKEKTVQALYEGTMFAFGVSEKEYGADLYNNQTSLTPTGDGKYLANGNKYYIGNANLGWASTIGKNTETGEFTFFLVDSKHRNYNPVKRINCSCLKQAYVAEYELIE